MSRHEIERMVWLHFAGAVQRQIARRTVQAPLLRRIADDARVDAMRERGRRPDGAGEGIADDAPARGPFRLYRPEEVTRTDAGNLRIRRMTEPGESALRRADAFDVMQAQADRRRKSRQSSVRLFTPAQVEAGRAYALLVERLSKAGIKCSSIEGIGGGKAGGDFMDALLRDSRRLDRMRAAIGDGWALEPKRAAPHGDRRRAIRARDLVDLVCVGDLTIAAVLDRFGWGRSIRATDGLRAALCDRLDCLYGI